MTLLTFTLLAAAMTAPFAVLGVVERWLPESRHKHPGCRCDFGEEDGDRCSHCGCCIHCNESCIADCPVYAEPAGTRCETQSCGCEGAA